MENEIETVFRNLGFEVIEFRDWKESRLYRQPCLTAVVKDAPYLSIYGSRTRIEFLLLRNGKQILIEAKRQNVSGSVDEKLPYVVANAQANIAQGRHFILIMDGNGWRIGAKKWVLNQSKTIAGFDVMTPTEFYHWLDIQSEPFAPHKIITKP